MMLNGVRSMVAKAMAVGMVAGVFALATPKKAEAQVSFGVQVGYPPVYAYGPGYYAYPPDNYARREYYERLRIEREREHEAWERHEAWEHHEGWEHDRDRRYDRDRDRDRDWDRR